MNDPHVLVDVGELLPTEVADGLQLEVDHPSVLVEVAPAGRLVRTEVTARKKKRLVYILCIYLLYSACQIQKQ